MPKTPLTKGGRALVQQLQADIEAVRAELDTTRVRAELDMAHHWNLECEPVDVAKYLKRAEGQLEDLVRLANRELDAMHKRIREELEPMLQRREDAQAQDDRLAQLESRVAQLEAQTAGPVPAPHIRVLKHGEG